MTIRQFRPMTAGTRFRSVSGFDEITRGTPEKSLLEPKKQAGGRNNQGHVTMRYKGGGHKRMYRRIDFKRDKFGIPGRVAEIEYDPNRSARIALIHYADGGRQRAGDGARGRLRHRAAAVGRDAHDPYALPRDDRRSR